MTSDREIGKRALDMQRRARDYALSELPGYWEWTKKRQAQGVPQEIIMNLDSTCMWLLPEDAENIGESDYDEFLIDLLEQFEETELLGLVSEKTDLGVKFPASSATGDTPPQPESDTTELASKNLAKWISDGRARDFVAARAGKWGDSDWEQLVQSLKNTEYWPIDPDRVGEELEKATREYDSNR